MVLQLKGHGQVAEAKTNPDGEFRFPGLAAGSGLQYRISAEVPEYTGEAPWMEVAAGGVSQVSVRLRQGNSGGIRWSSLSGVVVTSSGGPTQGAKVEVMRLGRVIESALTGSEGWTSTVAELTEPPAPGKAPPGTWPSRPRRPH